MRNRGRARLRSAKTHTSSKWQARIQLQGLLSQSCFCSVSHSKCSFAGGSSLAYREHQCLLCDIFPFTKHIAFFKNKFFFLKNSRRRERTRKVYFYWIYSKSSIYYLCNEIYNLSKAVRVKVVVLSWWLVLHWNPAMHAEQPRSESNCYYLILPALNSELVAFWLLNQSFFKIFLF